MSEIKTWILTTNKGVFIPFSNITPLIIVNASNEDEARSLAHSKAYGDETYYNGKKINHWNDKFRTKCEILDVSSKGVIVNHLKTD